jgi:hypothetical protein
LRAETTFIAMMQAADLREGNNVIACGRVAVQDEAVDSPC